MPISNNNIVLLKSTVVNDTAQNGGAMSGTVVADGVKNNIFPDVPKSERTNGSSKYRKLYYALRNTDNTAGLDAKAFVLKPTAANDAVLMIAGDKATQADITGLTRRYGAATLKTAAIVGASSITVVREQITYDIFSVGDTVAITARNETDSTSPLDFYTISNITISGSDNVLTLDRGLDNAMLAGVTVSSVLTKALIQGIISNIVSSASTINASQVSMNNSGAIDGNWTLTFTSATEFTATCSDISGFSQSGNIAATSSPNNPDTGNAYFSFASAFFNGAYAAGNTVTFKTQAAAMPIWLERLVPAGTSYLSGNSVIVGFEVESA